MKKPRAKPHWTPDEFRKLDKFIAAVRLTGKRARRGEVAELALAIGRSYDAVGIQLVKRRRGHR